MGWLTNKLLLFHFTIPFCFSPLRGRTMSVEWHKVWYWVDVSLNPDLALNCLNSLGVFSYTLKDDVLHSCDIGQCSWQYSSVQSLSRVWLFATPWTAACQASLPITNSQSLLKPMSIESVMPSNHLIPCRPLLPPSVFPSIRVFSNESALCIRWSKYWEFQLQQSVLQMNIQDWSPLGWTGWISLQSKGLSRVFSNTTKSISS